MLTTIPKNRLISGTLPGPLLLRPSLGLMPGEVYGAPLRIANDFLADPEATMPGASPMPSIPLPKNWPRQVRSAIVHAISMAGTAFSLGRSRTQLSFDARVRLQTDIERLGLAPHTPAKFEQVALRLLSHV